MTRVVFALERNAKTDPPKGRDLYITDLGIRVYDSDFGWGRTLAQPSWWYDLRPAEGEGVTVDDLEETVTALMALAVTLPSGYHRARTQQIFARLRTALDALT